MSTEVADLYVKLRATAGGFVGDMKAAESASLGMDGRLGAAMGTLSKFGIGVAAVGVGVGVATVKMASDFQSSMELIATQAHAPQAEVDRMTTAVLNMAATVGTSADQLAAGLYHIESTGVRGAKALEELRVAAIGAKVGHADLEAVTNALNAAVASGIPGVQNMSQAMGALNATVGAGDMRMQDLAEALGSGVLAVVKGFGLSLNDVGSALATFGDNNIRGANAATMLRMAVEAMAKPAATGKAALASLGLTTTQLSKDMQTGGLGKALTDIRGRLVATGNDGVKAGELLTEAFGKRAGPGIQVLIGQFTRFQSKQDEVRKGSGSLADDWTKTTQTFQFRMDQVGAALQSVGIKIGLVLIPWVEKAMDAFKAGWTWLQAHQSVMDALVAVLQGALVVALGAATAATIAWTMSLLANPVTWIVLAIIGLVAAIIYAYQHFTWFRDGVQTVWKAIQTVIGVVVTTVKGWIADLTKWIKDHHAEIARAAEILKVEFIAVWNIIWMAVKTAWTLIVATVRTAWDLLTGIIRIGWDIVSGIFSVALDLLTGHWSQAWTDMKNMLSNLWSDAKSLLYNVGTDIVQGLINGIESMVGNAAQAVSNIANALPGPIKSLLHINSPSLVFKNIGSSIPEGLALGIASGHGLVGSAMSAMAGITTGTQIGSELGVFSPGGGGLTGSPAASGGYAAVASSTPLQVHVFLDGREIHANQITHSQRYKLREGSTGLT